MKIAQIAALSAFLAAGCGKPPQAAPESLPPPVPAAAESKELSVFCLQGSLPASAIAEFIRETGIDVSVIGFPSQEEILAGLLHGDSCDVIQADEAAADALAKDGLLILAPEKIPGIDSGRLAIPKTSRNAANAKSLISFLQRKGRAQ
ncbi:MAG: hypothetical protein WCS65_17225 [Verrucomicrobiae bacterium]